LEEAEMNALKVDGYETVLSTVRQWPPDKRFALVRDVIDTLALEVKPLRSRRNTLGRALGLLATSQPVPPDHENDCVENLIF
jgi:hypothetical protein